MHLDAERVFRNWVEEHGHIVVKVARAYARSAEERDDLAQEILLQLWSTLSRFEGRAAVRTWIYRVALNTGIAWRRKERCRQRGRLPLAEESLASAAPASPEELVHREALARLSEAIHRLPDADRILVVMYLDDLSYRDISEVLGISESAVGVRLHRAKETLRRMLKETHHDA